MSNNPQPYDWAEAKAAIERASQNMKSAEEFTREAYKLAGAAEKAYRVALAKRIVELRAEGVPATVCLDLAKGDAAIADLRFRRDVAEGVKEAAKSATWRHTADRKDLTGLVEWSRRVAPEGQYEPRRVA
jgi:hypothetical protein